MIPLFKVWISEGVEQALAKTLRSGYIGEGPRVLEFENKLKDVFKNRNVAAVNSGTSAIHLALRLADVGPGTEVITTAMTCTATNMPILERGADIVWADVDPMTGNIDPAEVERKITKKTKAILCVHWGGYPCDLKALNRIADNHGISVIEDAAHALGAEYQGQRIGEKSESTRHSRFVCFSFQAIKHLTTGDGGALVCRDQADCERAKLLRWYGIDRNAKTTDLRCEEDIKEYGYKFHLGDLPATIGLSQLPDLPYILNRHKENGRHYEKTFRLAKPRGIQLLNYQPDRESAYWLFTMLVDDREGFMEWMKKQGVMVSQVHSRNDHHTAFEKFSWSLPGVDAFTRRQVSIPVGWWVKEEERTHIEKAVFEWSKKRIG